MKRILLLASFLHAAAGLAVTQKRDDITKIIASSPYYSNSKTGWLYCNEGSYVNGFSISVESESAANGLGSVRNVELLCASTNEWEPAYEFLKTQTGLPESSDSFGQFLKCPFYDGSVTGPNTFAVAAQFHAGHFSGVRGVSSMSLTCSDKTAKTLVPGNEGRK
jgi:hypothetical protein